jgi:ABC-type uncharacterized transport system substrate-binding protein
MKRREFIVGLGSTAAWPVVARAQQAAMPVVGYLASSTPDANLPFRTVFRSALSEMGFVESRNVTIEYRFANAEYDRLPELAADLVRRKVAVIVAVGGSVSALAAKAATATIPIIFGFAGDPVQAGLVSSFNRPGGNVTGVSTMTAELGAKQLGLLHELLPKATRFAALIDQNGPFAQSIVMDTQRAAASIGCKIEFFAVGSTRDISTAFATLVQNRSEAVVVLPDPVFVSREVQTVTLTNVHRLPAIFSIRTFVQVGGLMSYAPNLADQYRQMGIYTGRILKGERPADLPVMRPTKFEFVINLSTAQALGLDISPGLLAIADEVIE